MKNKLLNTFIAIVIFISFCFSSCSNLFIMQEDKKKSETIIGEKLQIFKEKGLLDSVLLNNCARSLEVDSKSVEEEINFFINNTDSCIEKIQNSKNGDKEIAILNSIYAENTIGEIYDSMLDFSNDLANEYETAIVALYNESVADSARFISNISTIRNIKSSFCVYEDSSRKADLSKSFSWGCVSGYVAASAGTIAGLLMWHYGGFWTRIAGLVVGGVGVATMATFYVIWQNSSEWLLFQSVCEATYNFVIKTNALFSNLTDKEKAQQFLNKAAESIVNYAKNNPQIASECDVLLKFIDDKYFKVRSFTEAWGSLITFFNDNTDYFGKTATVLTSTVAVGAVAWGTGFTGIVNGWIDTVKGLIPEWLTIRKDGFDISIKFGNSNNSELIQDYTKIVIDLL